MLVVTHLSLLDVSFRVRSNVIRGCTLYSGALLCMSCELSGVPYVFNLNLFLELVLPFSLSSLCSFLSLYTLIMLSVVEYDYFGNGSYSYLGWLMVLMLRRSRPSKNFLGTVAQGTRIGSRGEWEWRLNILSPYKLLARKPQRKLPTARLSVT